MNKFLLYIATILTLTACAEDIDNVTQRGEQQVTITSNIEPFVGEAMTRVNVEGNNFIDGDLIRMKIICPFVSGNERGEHTDGNSYDSFYYLKRSGSAWIRVVSGDGFDISGTYTASNSPDISSYYEAQQTPYVYVATTWSEERRFIANGNLYDHLTPVFHADQSKEKHYRASDVLWAQTFMQTGAWNIHLGFQHKMACLDITINDANLTVPNPVYDPADPESSPTIPATISDNAVLTLEGMPDIDQAEIVIGDYYADASKSNSGYGYRQKSSCNYDNNGKVLGIAVNDELASRARIMQMTGSPTPVGGSNSSVMTGKVANTATYTAFKQATKHYRLIVPPCNLDPDFVPTHVDPNDPESPMTQSNKRAVFWLRDGSRRFQVTLDLLKFEEGKCYTITLKLGTTPPPSSLDPVPGADSDPEP